ncbi:hypothetical protein WN51_00580 [Melipona quadrifasciata]|uniref:Uncharacterized protein n=1 Tax=Melipona quadrifasciata TaxID=166423 RepID=A0A0M8ZZW7_9HYME|nr:hypothetical protein WN51_00580 [Melipona quadrifasciata]
MTTQKSETELLRGLLTSVEIITTQLRRQEETQKNQGEVLRKLSESIKIMENDRVEQAKELKNLGTQLGLIATTEDARPGSSYSTAITSTSKEHEWTVIKYYPIPCQIHNVFLAPLIDHDMILEQAGLQIIINEYYLKHYCKNSLLGLICEHNLRDMTTTTGARPRNQTITLTVEQPLKPPDGSKVQQKQHTTYYDTQDISLGLITLYTLHKIGFFKALTKIVPNKLCIRMFCNTTNISLVQPTPPGIHMELQPISRIEIRSTHDQLDDLATENITIPKIRNKVEN